MIKILNKSEHKISFVSDINISLANAIRRNINSIPIMAIESLEITKNDSALYDEIIAHRVGLIPLKNEKIKTPEECGCGKEEGCTKCSMKFKLHSTGPCTVYSTDILPKGNIIYKMPITLLEKDQELEFVAVARMGFGKTHAKFSPGIMYYKYSEDDEIGDDKKFKKIVEESKKEPNKEISISIESWGSISPKNIFLESIRILDEDIKEFIKRTK